MSVDTLALAKELRAADFAGPQAEAIAAAIGRSIVETTATKGDLKQLGNELQAELRLLRSDLHAEIKATDARSIGRDDQLGAKIDNLASDLRAEIEKTKSSLLTWFVGTQIAVGAFVVALIKLLPAQG